jgi:hypothetical protein
VLSRQKDDLILRARSSVSIICWVRVGTRAQHLSESVLPNVISPPQKIPFSADLWPAMEPVWRQLASRTADHSAFLSPPWIEAWLEVFGPRLAPTGFIWRDAEGLPAACALISTKDGRLGPFRITRSFLNASGAGPGCEHNDVLAVEEFRDTVWDDLVGFVRDSGSDEFALVGVTDKAATAVRCRWPSESYEGHFSEAPYVSLERLRADGTSYASTLSANTRWQIRRSIRLFTETYGGLSVEVAQPGGQLAAWFSEMISLHEERWRREGESGAFWREPILRFHERLHEMCAAGQEPDQLAVDLLRVRFGEETIGLLYNLRYRGRVNFYQSGLRYHRDNRLKPGLVTHALAVDHYLAGGEDEYDFLGGEPGPVRYKRSLSTDIRTLAWIELPAPSLKMRVIDGIRHGRRRVRSIWKQHT